MWICNLGMTLLGFAFGLMVSGGVFTALLALGLVPRFAGKTHTAHRILTYESAVVSGCIFGGVISAWPVPEFFNQYIYTHPLFWGNIWGKTAGMFLAGGGFFGGCFVGCLALAIAEMLDSIPIFARRIRFREGLGIAVLAVAAGKVLGSILYFAARIYQTI